MLDLAGSASFPEQGTAPRVELITDQGQMIVTLDVARAPLTTGNFLGYVADGDYLGGSFFRTVIGQTNIGNPNPIDVIQAATSRGSDDDLRPPIPLERTRDTGLRHLAGTISMARDGPDTATSSFFIVTEDTPGLDFGGARHPDRQGFAAFGRLTEGLDVARRIQHLPTNGQELLTPPVVIRGARVISPAPAKCWP